MESDGSRLLLGSLIIFAIILIKGFFTACETAIAEVSCSKIKQMMQTDKKYAALYKLAEKPSKLITTFTLNKVLSTMILSLLAVWIYMKPLEKLISFGSEPYGAMKYLSPALSVFVIVILAVILISVLAESIPRKIAYKNSESFAIKITGTVNALIIILTPLRLAVSSVSGFILKLSGISYSAQRDVVTEEEIMMMVDAGNENGVIEETQREMISNIFEFGDLEVSDVMTHRTELYAVELNTKISEMVYVAINSGKSRIPVYEDDIDSIVGVVNVKDLLFLIGQEHTDKADLKEFLRDVIYLPETGKLFEAFKKLSAVKGQLAVVVDEYGGTAGIITMEDILEAIVGNIQDEYDNETEDIIRVSDGTYMIDGTAEPEDALEHLGITLPEDHEYETMSGFIIDLLGRIPKDDETPSVEYEKVKFTVLAVEDKRIVKIKAFLPPKKEEFSE